MKSHSALYCLSNPIAIGFFLPIPSKLRAELKFWIVFEGVHRNIHLEITVPIKLGDSGVGEDNTQATLYQDVSHLLHAV